ncbi:MAG: nucleoside-diphosphate kinase [Marinilabiliales bacterium]|nr:nucleoside-diphosphate kinase [Marinilabiliales bacterium]
MHKGKPFYEGLIDFMTSGPVVVMILKHENAVGAVQKADRSQRILPKAEPRDNQESLFAVSAQMNAVHGSDSIENAQMEANFFFSSFEDLFEMITANETLILVSC